MEQGFLLCKEFEKVHLEPYFDNKQIATIGIGMTRYPNGVPVTINDPSLTEQEAHDMYAELFDQHVDIAIKMWRGYFWRCPANFKNAYASFAYNTGHHLGAMGYQTLNQLINEEIVGANLQSDPGIEIKLNDAVLMQFAQAWMLYDDDRFDDGQQNNSTGLSIRRFAEVLILLQGFTAKNAYAEAYRRGNNPNDALDPTSLIH